MPGYRQGPGEHRLHLPFGCTYIIRAPPPVTCASAAAAENEHVWITSQLGRQNHEPEPRHYCLHVNEPYLTKKKTKKCRQRDHDDRAGRCG